MNKKELKKEIEAIHSVYGMSGIAVERILGLFDVYNQRELLIAFCATKHAKDVMEFKITVRDGVDAFLNAN